MLDARPASAHAQLLGSDPRADSTVSTQLDEITLTFNELVRGNFSTVVVTGPDGDRHGTGQPRAIDKRVHLPVQPVRSGGYRVAYRVVSADGHPFEGQFRFTVTLPPGEEPAPAPGDSGSATGAADAALAAGATTEETGSGTGWWRAGAIPLGAVLVTAGFFLVRRGRRTSGR
ncbi:copper resistance protein CopC [Plantactinospora sp. S1510]|uniref:Copper resistance protein CopC n=1 Tax=Plantactinospora alkalitolerans TaxID=2789879 RepID=A0ABS0GXK1_9ACTN|nr:copper resistance CopC family protein [Plantactinospora alkalitolerans]MBF9130916.1 copper resistance protein CopC [Plantactinospora alkalitolerans]